MTRPLRIVAAVVAALLLSAVAVVWDVAIRAPSVDLLALPPGLTAVDSPAGRQLLGASRFVADYAPLMGAFEAQSRRAFCGVASSVIVLNALRRTGPRATQSALFPDALGEMRVTFGGMTLAELADVLRSHGADVAVFYASDADADAFRAAARQNLQTDGDFVLVNYERAVLKQGPTGHISPLAAYNADADQLLILDVAAYKYPPVWVATTDLWNAMNTTDPASGRSRGFVVVHDGRDAAP